MTTTRLSVQTVEKPWGRRDLGFGFSDVAWGGAPIGEIWFATPEGAHHELMVKYLFTSERLSIQVHPNDGQALARGQSGGKEEAWVILAAELGAVIAMGLKVPMSSAALRAAALDGTIEGLMDWKPVKAGDIFYIPAGTIHAIGAGITLIEVQQNVDLTYRLYDYGRPRELHLDDGIAVSNAGPFEVDNEGCALGIGRIALVTGRKFVVEKWSWTGTRTLAFADGVTAWLIPVGGKVVSDEQDMKPGDCAALSGEVNLSLAPGSELFIAYSGTRPLPFFRQK